MIRNGFPILHPRHHVGERHTLEAWLIERRDGHNEQLLGPKDTMTGQMRQAPVPCSPKITPIPQRQGQPPPTISQQRGQASLMTPVSPDTSSWSRSSSISTLPTMMVMPDMPLHSTKPGLFTTACAPITTFIPRNSSVSSNSTIDSLTHGIAQLTSPSSNSEHSSRLPSSASPPVRHYKVTLSHLPLQATTELVGELIEQKVRKYVTLVQPDPIKLQKFKGQSQASVKFLKKNDAEKAVRELQKFHATLEVKG